MVGVDMMNRSSKIDITATDRFPAGLRVLAVDDDPTCLMILAQQLRKCSYEVTMCTRAAEALSILRENRDSFDLVISDVYMPDMDGFKLLEYVGLEMDLPVIMTSSHGETSVVMKGVTHGACDYLLKPVRIEELRNIWQHVVRKKRINESKDVEASGSVDDVERQRRGSDECEYTSSVNDGADGNWKLTKKRKDDDDNDHEYEDPSTLKKQRVVWSVELHQQFVNAVNHLGIDKAVPKKILELMNVQGLTRENVASHLQKYRLYLRRLSGVHPSTPSSGFSDSSSTLPDIRSFAGGQLSQHALASIQGGLMSRVGGPHVQSGVGMSHPSVLMSPVVQGGAFYRSHQPPPLMNIPAARGIDLEGSQISPRTPVDEVAVPGLSVLQHQLANVGGIGRAGNVANGSSLLLSPHSTMSSILAGGAGGSGEVRPSPGNMSTYGGFSDKVLPAFRTAESSSNKNNEHSFHSNDGSFPIEGFPTAKDLTGCFSSSSTSNGRAFGRIPSGYQHPTLGDKVTALPARFAVDGGEDQENVNFRVKLEGAGNETDDLFSIILKQQQQQQQQQQQHLQAHQQEGMSAFSDSDYLM